MGGGPRVIHLTDPDAVDVSTLPVLGVPDNVNTVQLFLEYLLNRSVTSASPGFTWGRSGNCPPGTYLLNDTVPSNISGRPIFLYNALLLYVYVTNKLSTTYTLDIEMHNKVTYTNCASVTVTSNYAGLFRIDPGFSLTRGWELAAKVSENSANSPQNIDAGILMTGELAL